MDELKIILEINDEIKKFDTIICHRHINPDGDAFGSQLGMKKLILLNYPKKKVYAVGTQTDKFKTYGLMDNVEDKLYKDALIIITDTGNEPRIEDKRYKLAKKVIKIDHHPNEFKFGDIQWADPKYTSASEMVAKFARDAKLKIDIDTASTIMSGIISDTNKFSITNMTAETFSLASFLMQTDMDIQVVMEDLYKKEFSYLKAEAEVIQKIEIKNGVGALYLTKDIMEKYNIPYDNNDIFVNLLEGCVGVEIRVVFAANNDGTYRVEFRSKSIPVKQIAEKYGGGGHKLIAGATIANLKIAKQIFDDLVDVSTK